MLAAGAGLHGAGEEHVLGWGRGARVALGGDDDLEGAGGGGAVEAALAGLGVEVEAAEGDGAAGAAVPDDVDGGPGGEPLGGGDVGELEGHVPIAPGRARIDGDLPI